MNSSIHILIADDDTDDVAFLVEGISEVTSCCKISYAKDGVQCLRFLANNPPPGIIFLDLNMPLKNGFECLKVIRENPLLNNTTVTIVSTSHYFNDVDSCYRLGADFYIIKPTSMGTLVNLLQQLFNTLSQAEAEKRPKEKFVLMDEKILADKRSKH